MSNTEQRAFTPGPWSYEDPHDGCCGRACTPNGCHESHPTGIYVVHGPDEADMELLDCYGLALRNEADARLIAAAPDLLAALQMAEFHVLNHGKPEEIKQLSAALTRATTS